MPGGLDIAVEVHRPLLNDPRLNRRIDPLAGLLMIAMRSRYDLPEFNPLNVKFGNGARFAMPYRSRCRLFGCILVKIDAGPFCRAILITPPPR